MIPPWRVAEIRRLLAEGKLSQRQIARKTGVSRGTVNAIARGKRQDRIRRHEPDGQFAPPSGPLRRCPGCGGMVQMPCLLCHVRALRKLCDPNPTGR
ncbi:MAG: helix-turn-helix domain-containing protein [Thermoguttaceae bacterium]